MDINNTIEFQIIKNGRTYRLTLPSGSPFGEMYDVAYEILGEVVKFAQEAAQKAKPQEIPATKE